MIKLEDCLRPQNFDPFNRDARREKLLELYKVSLMSEGLQINGFDIAISIRNKLLPLTVSLRVHS